MGWAMPGWYIWNGLWPQVGPGEKPPLLNII
jgi:hypothetical protein